MYEYDEECLKTFLERQSQLFDEPVAETLEEAEAFLEDCMAVVADSLEERLPVFRRGRDGYRRNVSGRSGGGFRSISALGRPLSDRGRIRGQKEKKKAWQSWHGRTHHAFINIISRISVLSQEPPGWRSGSPGRCRDSPGKVVTFSRDCCS